MGGGGYVTVSVDDGSQHDLRTADLLTEHGLRATFYVPAESPRELTPAQIRTLDEGFEVGSHSFNHVDLTTVPTDVAEREVRDGKAWLEDVLGHNISAFAYPFGAFNSAIASLVASTGFLCARTCLLNRVDAPDDPFRLGMTTDAYDHSRRTQFVAGVRARNFGGLRNYVLTYRLVRDWETHFQRALDVVGAGGGVAHLVVHSDMIERNDAWAKLDRVLSATTAAPLKPLTNTEVLTSVP